MTPSSILTRRDGDTLVVTFARPRVLNALDRAAITAFAAATRTFDDPTLRAIVLTGEGRAFVSGGDLRDFAAIGTPSEVGAMVDEMRGALRRLEDAPALSIAAIDGACFGGGVEIALACDLRIAGADASFGFSQGRIGLNQGWGGSRRLVDAVGYARALEWLATGARLDPHAALAGGLVSHVEDNAEAAAMELAERAGRAFGSSGAAMKRTLRAAVRDREHVDDVERDAFLELWFAEGRDALVADLLARLSRTP